ncbi:hypothetical protein XH80_03200 [Bradyrhizobium sp. CCBAU 45384]|nr:hypothetical protein [Bradyrhizobium sp. CCBAU 45384]
MDRAHAPDAFFPCDVSRDHMAGGYSAAQTGVSVSGAHGLTLFTFTAIQLRTVNARPLSLCDEPNAVSTIAAFPGRPPLTWTASTQLSGPFFLHASERQASPARIHAQHSGHNARPDEEAEQFCRSLPPMVPISTIVPLYEGWPGSKW